MKVWIDTDEDPEPTPKLTINGVQYDGTAPVIVETRPLYVAVTNTGGRWTIGNTLAEIEAAYQAKRPVGLTYSSAALAGNTYALNLVQRYSATDWLFGGIATAAINVLVRLSSSGNTETITTLAKQDQIPTALKNPNALTINGTSYDGSAPVEMTIQGGGGGTSEPDWNAAEGEPGHILNRTHWSEWAEVLPEQTLAYSEDDDIYMTETALVFVVGEAYRVKLDGVEYECVAWALVEEGITIPVIGNKIELSGEDTGEPFVAFAMEGLLQFMLIEPKPEITLSISTQQYHKIPGQYLPKYAYVIPVLKEEIVASTSDRLAYKSLDTTELVDALLENRPVYLDFTDVRNGTETRLFVCTWSTPQGTLISYPKDSAMVYLSAQYVTAANSDRFTLIVNMTD